MNRTCKRYRLIIQLILCSLIIGCNTATPDAGGGQGSKPKYLEQVSYQEVQIDDPFWSRKIKASRENGLRSVFESGKSSLTNFEIAAGIKAGDHNQMMASDSDIYKIIQGVAYALHHTPDQELEAFTDKLIDTIVAAQQEDGYLFTPYIAGNPEKRWTDLKKDHELYCAGHLFEAGIAYYEVTGKMKLLDAAVRLADHIDAIFGPEKRIEIPGHQEIELALFKLYKTTGNEKYLKLSTFFIDERGNPARVDTIPPGYDPHAGTPHRWRHPSYRQDHLPVEKQYQATGHGVRAVYMYAALSDLEMEAKSGNYMAALDSIWEDIVTRKMFVTAGIGTHEFHDEGFGTPYNLPTNSAYSETCAGIGFTFWARRMNRLYGHAKYADLVELLIYNAAISSVSLEGDEFFYRNLLESAGDYRRRPWFNPACCPSSMVRFLPEIGALVYAKDEEGIYVNQFIGNEANISLSEGPVTLKMQSNYLWEGKVTMEVSPKQSTSFKLHIRLPGWARGEFLPGSDLYTFADNLEDTPSSILIKVNGDLIDQPPLINGYLVLERNWEPGDRVTLNFPMTIHAVQGHPKIEATKGKVALMRGPVVYCMEEVDNPGYFSDDELTYRLIVDSLSSEYNKNLLGGVVSLKGMTSGAANENQEVFYVPYFSWANREKGKMTVWATVD